MDYLLKSSALIIVFYFCYTLFLRCETFFQSNRWFLLSGLIITVSIPLIVIPHYIEYNVVETTGFVVNTNATEANPVVIEEAPFDYLKVLFWVYSFGIVFFFGKLVLEFLSLYRILNSATLKSNHKFKLLETSEIEAPFSFFNNIVYNPSQFKTEELDHVINHEKVHAQQYHSIDTMIAQLACVLFWFNPFMWFYKNALQQNLEFIADQKAQYISSCNKSYQTVLLKASITNHHMAITNNFYTSLIKKRIVMLHKSKSNPLHRIKLFFVLPLLALFMMSFNVKDVYVAIPLDDINIFDNLTQTHETIEILITKDTNDEELEVIKKELLANGISFTYSGVKRNSKGEITAINTEFKSDEHFSNFNLSSGDPIKAFRFKSDGESFGVGTINKGKNNFIYHTNDGKTKVQSSGTHSNVFVFENDDDDKTEDVKVKVKKAQGNNVFITNEASGGTWISKDGTKTNINASENGNANVFIAQSDDPLFIVNGKAVSKSLFEDVDSDDIQSINVLKGKTALESFGDKGKNGVVILTKKGSKNLFTNEDSDSAVKFSLRDKEGNQPLIIINDKEATESQIKALDPNYIISFDVLKDKSAIKTYGKKGKYGVIKIVTKKEKPIKILQSSGDDNYLYILDGKEISKSDLLKVYSKETVSSLKVLNANQAIEKYGDKGKNGVVIVTSKYGATVVGQNEPVIIEIEDASPNSNSSTVQSVFYIDDSKQSIEFIITKNSSDAFLNKQKSALKSKGIDAKFTKVRRNKAGEITSIKISLDDNQGRKSSASWKEKEQAIPDIVMGKSGKKLFVRALGN